MKRWVNAKITITPNATNEVGQPHTFTVTLAEGHRRRQRLRRRRRRARRRHADRRERRERTPTPTGTCTNAGANTDAIGQCTITFTSPTAGKVTGHATSTLSVVGSAPFTVADRRHRPNSADAVKTFVDANIQITPPTATNRVGQTHTFTAHVNVNNGSGAASRTRPTARRSASRTTPARARFSTPNPCTVTGGTG